MRQIALISQPLRLAHCVRFLNDASGDNVVMTGNPAAFAEVRFESPTQVVPIRPPEEVLPTSRLARARLFRRVADWSRSGSRIGMWIERLGKRILWSLRYLDRVVILNRRRTPRDLSRQVIQQSTMFHELEHRHRERDIDRIVVFDVFDLPVAVEFSNVHGVEVIVR